ncbi:MAG: DUF2147 domain-containing protein [Cetobacterium sp.]|uniref:DUF2147 domain-containing protein n=1 Tax=Cetobacterium sp. TaxID=2071632 RepID=UPI003F2EE575
MKKIILLMMILIGTLSFSQENSMDPYVGYWKMPDGKAVIQIERNNNEYVGYVRWLKDEKYPIGDKMVGQEQIDRNNPDPKLRNREVMGLQVVGDLHENEENNKLIGGWIYDSWNGRKYYGTVEALNKNTLKLRGSLDKWGILGYSMDAKRVNLIKK